MAEDKKQVMNNINQLIQENEEMTKRLQQATDMMRDMHSQNQNYKSQISDLKNTNKDLEKKLQTVQTKVNNKFEEQERLKTSEIIKEAQNIRDNTISRADKKADDIINKAHENAKIESDNIINAAKTKADYYEEKAKNAQQAYELTNHKLEQLQDVIKNVLDGKTFLNSVEEVNHKADNNQDNVDTTHIVNSQAGSELNVPMDIDIEHLMDDIQKTIDVDDGNKNNK